MRAPPSLHGTGIDLLSQVRCTCVPRQVSTELTWIMAPLFSGMWCISSTPGLTPWCESLSCCLPDHLAIKDWQALRSCSKQAGIVHQALRASYTTHQPGGGRPKATQPDESARITVAPQSQCSNAPFATTRPNSIRQRTCSDAHFATTRPNTRQRNSWQGVFVVPHGVVV